MKKLIYLFFLMGFAALTTQAQSEIIFTLETVKVKNNNHAEALFYFEYNWKMLREKALEKKYIHSYELIETKSEKDADFDIILITRYSNKEQFDKSEENFQKLIKEFITDKGGLKFKNEKKPDDFREYKFYKVGSVIK